MRVLHTIGHAISIFFQRTGFIIGAILKVIFGGLLPALLAIAVLGGMVIVVVTTAMVIADSLGWTDRVKKVMEEEKRKEELERKEKGGGGEEGDIERSAGEIIDVGGADAKRRVLAEIEILEGMLEEKRKQLERL